MGSAIKKAANATIRFFREVGEKIVGGTKKVVEIIVDGVKKVATFFKKVISYSLNEVKIVGKLFYIAGKQIIHTLLNKKGITHLKEYLNELKKKNISIEDENNNEVEPESFCRDMAKQMQEGDTVKIKQEIIRKETKSEKDSFKDFEGEDDPIDILGLTISDSFAKVEGKEISLDNISNADTDLENY